MIAFLRLQRLSLFALTLMAITAGCDGGQSAAEHLMAGQAAAAKGEWRTAMIELKNAIDREPENPAARALLGQVFVRQGDPVSARVELERAETLGAGFEAIQPWLARAWLGQGKRDKVIDLVIPSGVPDGLRAELLALQAESLLASNRQEEAIERASEALDLPGASASALLSVARVLATTGERDEARTLVKQALEQDAELAAAWVLLGSLEQVLGDLDAAELAYGEAVDDAVQGDQARLQRALVRLQSNRLAAAEEDIVLLRQRLPSNPIVDYAEGLLRYTQGDYAAALARLDTSLGRLPDHGPSLALAGSAQMALGRPELARAHLERAVTIQPDNLGVKRLLGLAYQQLGQPDEAERMAREVLDQAPADIATMDLLANALMAQGKGDQSLTYLRQVKAVSSDSAAASARLGIALLGQGDTKAGLDALQEALEQDPSLRGPAEQLVLGFVRSGDLDQALAAARAYRDQEPGLARAHTLLGAVQFLRKEIASASEAFEKALTVDATSLSATNGLAAIALQEKDLDKATQYFERGLDAHPGNYHLLIMLARLALVQEDTEKAKRHLDQAIERRPDAHEAKLYLAAYYLKAGEPDKALDTLKLLPSSLASNRAVLGMKADAQLALKQARQAQATLETLVALMPENPKVNTALGIAYAGTGDLERARAALLKARELDPDFVPAINGLARLAIAEGKTADAERYLRVLKARLSPVHPDVLMLEGRLAQLKGDVSAASKVFDQLLDTDGDMTELGGGSQATPWSGAEQMVLGYVRSGDLSGAIKAADELRDRHPDAARAHALLGSLLMRDGQQEKAQASFLKALELEPGNLKATAAMATLALRERNLAEAQRYYEEALAQHPRNAGLLVGLARLALQRDQDQEKARDYLEKAARSNPDLLMPKLYLGAFHLRAGDPKRTLALLNEARAEHPNNASLLGLLAEAEMALRNWKGAQGVLQDLIRSAPSEQGWLALAKAEAGLGNDEEARSALEQALRANPDSAPALLATAQLAVAQASATEAQERIAALEAIVGAEHGEVLLLKARLAERESDLAKAAGYYERLFDASPSSRTLTLLARARVGAGDVTGAEEVLKAWLEAHPEDVAGHMALSQLYLSSARHEEAIRHMQSVLEVNPDNPVALNNLAWLLREQDTEKALGYARRAYELAPTSAEITDTLAMVTLQSGDASEARHLINVAVQGDPDNGSLLWHKAQILQATGDLVGAKRALRTALHLAEPFPEQDQARAMLERLQGD